MKVKVFLHETSQPIEYENVKNTYQKGFMYCVYFGNEVDKYPKEKIWRVRESYSKSG